MKISVIMPCFLGDYPNAAADRPARFIRAVKSFLDQRWQGSELIIVADGCQKTAAVFNDTWWAPELEEFAEKGYPLRLIQIDKQPHFSGAVRNKGLQAAQGEVICYLDMDDVLMAGHLQGIYSAFVRNPEHPETYRRWVYFNDFLAGPGLSIMRERPVHLAYGGIGTGMFAHERSLELWWPDGYGHDWGFVQRLMEVCPHTARVTGPRYLVCHIPGQLDV